MLQFFKASPDGSFRPPAPQPQQSRLGFFRLLATLKRNPLECWSQEFFEEPIANVKLPFMQTFLVHDPAAIKHVLVDNASNYRKDPIQRRILASGLADGLLSVEGAPYADRCSELTRRRQFAVALQRGKWGIGICRNFYFGPIARRDISPYYDNAKDAASEFWSSDMTADHLASQAFLKAVDLHTGSSKSG